MNLIRIKFKNGSDFKIGSMLGFLIPLAVAMMGYHINNHSLGWAIVDFFFFPFAIIKWLICQEICWSVIKHTFSFLCM